jgi:hypothetical protein
MNDKTYEHWSERYKWVPEYNRDTAWDWYDTYMELCYGSSNPSVDELIDLADDANKIIGYLLNATNRSISDRFEKGKPMFLVKVPHTKSNYYAKDDDSGILFVTDEGIERIKSFPVNEITFLLFTHDEIKYFGLEDCDKLQYLY